MVTTTTGFSSSADADDALEHDAAPDSQFESYFEAATGAWTLRRIPSTPPEPEVAPIPV